MSPCAARREPTMSEELKACPFCASKHVPTSCRGNTGRFQYVCSLCGARGPKADTSIEAYHAWNRRAEPPRVEVPEMLPLRFPPQPNGEGGWSISTEFIKAVEAQINAQESDRCSWEEIESVLLAAQQVVDAILGGDSK